MDFHSLSRKELQDLCKKNKIPANMTNIAMADALEALDKVEGLLEEFTNVSARQKMESTAMEIVEQQEKNNVPKTPATRSSRRMAPAVSARGKVEAQKEQKSVQRVYNTRSAVRLLEKGMEGLGLKEKERIRPLKMDVEIEDVETEDESGVDLLTLSEKSSKKITDTEAVACQNLDHLLGEKREVKRELQEESYSELEEDYNPKQEMGSEKCDSGVDLYSEVLSLDNASEMNNELEEDDKSNDYEMDRYNPESEGLNEYSSNNESLENSNPIVVESSEKALTVTQELIYNNDSPTLIVSQFVEDKQHDNHDLQSNFATVEESDRNQSDEAKENGNAERVVEAGGAMPGQTTGLLPFEAGTLKGQFPRPSEVMTPEINKENIDDNGIKMEPKKEKAYNKEAAIDEKMSDELSLRQLRKMMREKLQMSQAQ
ncbi:ASPARTIC/GLUTAMIC ACID-RICH PROTEIN [Salix koriyanagi]|uniref:ASPARTIC/GLUTAMIC ACID-RICH PROTEIN n=1 Tax=Salix koriyanagi TaxID=2511006 RepID=A0A9Q0W8I4_9ROSI|nr:ASPARTIC/GLUTAMIC ACID-RICH PROTEIN [Salix koriyanagi]